MTKDLDKPYIQEALLYKELDGNIVECGTCSHRCKIAEGKYGLCKTRFNQNGVLYTETYGVVSSYLINPIEKKPLFHFYPGSFAATIGSYSCNFTCPWCQNWEISKKDITALDLNQESYFPPETIVTNANTAQNVTGLSMSFNEPTLSLEYALDIFNHPASADLYKMFVTNGYLTHEALEELLKAGMTGMAITVKGNYETVKKYCGADVRHVWSIIELAKAYGIHVEIICLIIPTVNDDPSFFKEVAEHIKQLDMTIPLHFTRFFPDYKFQSASSTPIATLEQAHKIAKEAGLDYVYLGNVDHPLEDTYCPKCQELLIERSGNKVVNFDFDYKQCPYCEHRIPIVV